MREIASFQPEKYLALAISPLFLKVRNAQVAFAVNPQKKINSLEQEKHGYLKTNSYKSRQSFKGGGGWKCHHCNAITLLFTTNIVLTKITLW